MDKPTHEMIDKVIALEAEMDDLQREARKGHFDRLNTHECTPESGVYYLEIVNNLERISDLCKNLVSVLPESSEIA